MYTFDNLSDREYWKRLHKFWIECEDPKGASSRLISLFKSSRGERNALMTAEEQAVLAALPDPATLYRGITFFPGNALKYARGMSWTDDLDIAAHFAHPDSKWLAGAVLKAEVPRWRVLAYFQERGEHEVVIDPRHVNYCVLCRRARESTRYAIRTRRTCWPAAYHCRSKRSLGGLPPLPVPDMKAPLT